MSDQSIEFQQTKENIPLQEIVRKTFRVPVEDRKKAWVLIKGNRYQVLNICPDGIGIALENDSGMSIDQTLLNCTLCIFDEKIQNLKGRIVHLTLDEEKNLMGGVQWIDMEKGSFDQILQIVLKMKKQLLKEG